MSNFKGRPFTDVLGELDNGDVLRDLTEATYNMVAACTETGKPGKITLTLEFKPTGLKTMVIHTDIKAKEPEHDRPGTTFFRKDDFSLHRNDPNQPRLPLVQVEKPSDPPIRVAD